jgi:hypothetical protein
VERRGQSYEEWMDRGIASPHMNGGALNKSNISGPILIDSFFFSTIRVFFLSLA